MLASFFNRIIKNKSRKALFVSVLAILILGLISGVFQLKINQDITASLPKGERFKELNSFLKSSKLNNQLAFSLETKNLSLDKLESLAEETSNKINENCSNEIKEIKYYSEFDESDFYSYYNKKLAVFLTDDDFEELKNKTSDQAIRTSLEANFKKLISPEGTFVKQFILEDPLSLTPLVLNRFSSNQESSYLVEDGITYSKDKKLIFFFTELNPALNNDAKEQSVLAKKLNDIKIEWNRNHKENQLDYFSPFLITVANADQIKVDTTLTLGIFIGFTLLLLFLYYRKLSTPFFFLLPAVFGMLFSLGLIGWFKDGISAISIGAGAIVLGIILDFAFHFFTHFKDSNSLSDTLKDITFPLLTGSFTTIIAFLALQYTNSVILQDFGLFAALSLLGAALFTLLALPVILHISNFSFGEVKPLFSSFNFTFSKIQNKYLILFIGFFTVFFLFKAQDIEFDSDLENLGFHPQELKDSEKAIFDLNPENEKKIFLFSKGESISSAEDKNHRLYEKLEKIDGLKEITSVAQFSTTYNQQIVRSHKWKVFWDENKKRVFKTIDIESARIGFSENAFNKFKSKINQEIKISRELDIEFLNNVGVDKLIDLSGEEPVFITTVVVDKENKEAILKQLYQLEDVEVLDRSSMVSGLLEVVRKDFNFILFASSLIVFITLLLVYGRIELALIVFVPMVISWIWILGLVSLLGIQFNFVNIIITTFIFGLGDDFSIFISDGILNKYKHNKKTLGIYKTGIILSAITTIVGTGVLMLAKHPAVNSIGLVSVLGMLCILFISLTLQPILYDWLIFNRLNKGRSPWTLKSWLVSAFAYSYFVFGCFVASIIATFFLIIPLSKKMKRKGMSTILHYFGASLLYIMFNVTKRFFDRENLDLTKPSILIANHSSVLDIIITLTISEKVLLVTNKWVYNSPFFGYLVRTAGFVLNTDIEENLDTVKEKMADGYSIMLFPEGTRSKTGEIGRFKKGAFYLAEKLEADITPVLIHGAHFTMAKSDFQLKDSWLNVKFHHRIEYADKSFGNTYRERSKSITKLFKEKHREFSLEMSDTKFLKEPILYNYIYKGPVLEWYYKIKWELEKENYAYYDQVISKNEKVAKKILDLGCGYGFLDYFLLLRNQEREILGLDYDQEKVSIAQHNYIKTDNINFVQRDLRELELETKYDVIFILDVLHYFNTEDQKKVLITCFKNLNDQGILFIRDGISDLKERHKTTQWTEFFSSNLGFNRKDEDFCFFDKQFIENLALEFNFSLEIKEQSKKTSNVLFILKKN